MALAKDLPFCTSTFTIWILRITGEEWRSIHVVSLYLLLQLSGRRKEGLGCVCVKMSPDFLFAKNVGYCHVVLKPILIEGE